jgi:hypothetical protein
MNLKLRIYCKMNTVLVLSPNASTYKRVDSKVSSIFEKEKSIHSIQFTLLKITHTFDNQNSKFYQYFTHKSATPTPQHDLF